MHPLFLGKTGQPKDNLTWSFSNDITGLLLPPIKWHEFQCLAVADPKDTLLADPVETQRLCPNMSQSNHHQPNHFNRSPSSASKIRSSSCNLSGNLPCPVHTKYGMLFLKSHSSNDQVSRLPLQQGSPVRILPGRPENKDCSSINNPLES